jgi:hypothetical protein
MGFIFIALKRNKFNGDCLMFDKGGLNLNVPKCCVSITSRSNRFRPGYGCPTT